MGQREVRNGNYLTEERSENEWTGVVSRASVDFTTTELLN